MTETPTHTPLPYECFRDASYYDMWCVRRVNEREWGKGFHLVNGDEAAALRDLLNTRADSHHRLVEALEWYGDTFCELGKSHECCGRLTDDECSGCKARSLQPIRGTQAMTEIEQEVSEAMAANPHYPLGEPDAMKWAVAWRLTRDRNGINANASNAPGEDVDGWMVGWFANCMASARPEMLMQRSIEEPKA